MIRIDQYGKLYPFTEESTVQIRLKGDHSVTRSVYEYNHSPYGWESATNEPGVYRIYKKSDWEEVPTWAPAQVNVAKDGAHMTLEREQCYFYLPRGYRFADCGENRFRIEKLS